MKIKDFSEVFLDKKLTDNQEAVFNAVANGELKLIGFDIGKPNRDKTCRLYGKEVNGQIFIDEVTLEEPSRESGK